LINCFKFDGNKRPGLNNCGILELDAHNLTLGKWAWGNLWQGLGKWWVQGNWPEPVQGNLLELELGMMMRKFHWL
jgi:hypothetical protein